MHHNTTIFIRQHVFENIFPECQPFCRGLSMLTHICVGELGQHWFRQWLVACSAPSHNLNQCCRSYCHLDRLAKRPLVFNGRLAKRRLTSLVKEAIGNKFQWNLNRNLSFSFKKIYLKMSSGNCRPSCPGLNMLTHAYFSNKHVQGVGCCPPTVSVRMSDLTRPQYLTQHLLIYGRRNPRVNRKNLRTRGLDWDTNWNHIPRSTFWLVSGTSSSTTWWNRIELARETLAGMWGSSAGKRSTPGCDVKALQLTSKRIYNDIAWHDDVIKWRHFPRYWPFVRGIHRFPVNSLTKASDAELWRFLWSAPE